MQFRKVTGYQNALMHPFAGRSGASERAISAQDHLQPHPPPQQPADHTPASWGAHPNFPKFPHDSHLVTPRCIASYCAVCYVPMCSASWRLPRWPWPPPQLGGLYSIYHFPCLFAFSLTPTSHFPARDLPRQSHHTQSTSSVSKHQT